MALYLPPELDFLGWLVGVEWPEGNEDQMWELANQWKAAAQGLRGQVSKMDDAKYATLAAYVDGQGRDAMAKVFDNLAGVGGHQDGNTSILDLADFYDQIGGSVHDTGTEIESTKLMFYTSLVMLAGEMLAAWIFPPTAPAVEAAAQAATRVAVRIIAKRALAAIEEYVGKLVGSTLAKFMVRHFLLDAGLGVLQEAGIEGYQVAAGHRSGMDWGKVGVTAISSAAGGIAGGKVGKALGEHFESSTMNHYLTAAITGTSAGLAGAGTGFIAGTAAQFGLDAYQHGLGDAWKNTVNAFTHFDPRMLSAGALNGSTSALNHTAAHSFWEPRVSRWKAGVSTDMANVGAVPEGNSGGSGHVVSSDSGGPQVHPSGFAGGSGDSGNGSHPSGDGSTQHPQSQDVGGGVTSDGRGNSDRGTPVAEQAAADHGQSGTPQHESQTPSESGASDTHGSQPHAGSPETSGTPESGVQAGKHETPAPDGGSGPVAQNASPAAQPSATSGAADARPAASSAPTADTRATPSSTPTDSGSRPQPTGANSGARDTSTPGSQSGPGARDASAPAPQNGSGARDAAAPAAQNGSGSRDASTPVAQPDSGAHDVSGPAAQPDSGAQGSPVAAAQSDAGASTPAPQTDSGPRTSAAPAAQSDSGASASSAGVSADSGAGANLHTAQATPVVEPRESPAAVTSAPAPVERSSAPAGEAASALANAAAPLGGDTTGGVPDRSGSASPQHGGATPESRTAPTDVRQSSTRPADATAPRPDPARPESARPQSGTESRPPAGSDSRPPGTSPRPAGPETSRPNSEPTAANDRPNPNGAERTPNTETHAEQKNSPATDRSADPSDAAAESGIEPSGEDARDNSPTEAPDTSDSAAARDGASEPAESARPGADEPTSPRDGSEAHPEPTPQRDDTPAEPEAPHPATESDRAPAESTLGDESVPRDESAPRDEAAPHDPAAPRDEAVPRDGTSPRDEALPRDEATPRDEVAPHDPAVPRDEAVPRDGASPRDEALPHDEAGLRAEESASDVDSGVRSEDLPLDGEGRTPGDDGVAGDGANRPRSDDGADQAGDRAAEGPDSLRPAPEGAGRGDESVPAAERSEAGEHATSGSERGEPAAHDRDSAEARTPSERTADVSDHGRPEGAHPDPAGAGQPAHDRARDDRTGHDAPGDGLLVAPVPVGEHPIPHGGEGDRRVPGGERPRDGAGEGQRPAERSGASTRSATDRSGERRGGQPGERRAGLPEHGDGAVAHPGSVREPSGHSASEPPDAAGDHAVPQRDPATAPADHPNRGRCGELALKLLRQLTGNDGVRVPERPVGPEGMSASEVVSMAGGRLRGYEGHEAIADRLRELGPGSSALVIDHYAGPTDEHGVGAHAYLLVNEGGEIVVKDPAAGREHGFPPEVPHETQGTHAILFKDDGTPVDPLSERTRQGLLPARVGHGPRADAPEQPDDLRAQIARAHDVSRRDLREAIAGLQKATGFRVAESDLTAAKFDDTMRDLESRPVRAARGSDPQAAFTKLREAAEQFHRTDNLTRLVIAADLEHAADQAHAADPSRTPDPARPVDQAHASDPAKAASDPAHTGDPVDGVDPADSAHPRAVDPVAEAREFGRRVEEAIGSGEASVEVISEGALKSAQRVELVTFEDGTQLIRKLVTVPAHADAEELASLVGRAVGVDVPRVYRDPANERVVYMDLMPGETAASHHESEFNPALIYHDTPEGLRMGLFDALLEIPDRNPANWMVGPDGHLIAIDHSLAFGNDARARDPISQFARQFAEHGPNRETVWRDHELTRSELAEVRARLDALAPEFERAGHPEWHEAMRERLDQIEQHARPDEPAEPSREAAVQAEHGHEHPQSATNETVPVRDSAHGARHLDESGERDNHAADSRSGGEHAGHEGADLPEHQQDWGAQIYDEWNGLNAEQIAERLESRWDIDIFGFDPAIHPGVLREFARAVDEMFSKYPATNVRSVGIGKLPEGVYARSKSERSPTVGWYAEKIIFNEDFARRPEELAQRAALDESSGHHVPGGSERPIYATIVHEFAHSVDFTGQGAARHRIMPALLKHYVAEHGNLDNFEPWLKESLSRYSFNEQYRIDTPEALAEAFTDVELNGPNASDAAKVIHRVLLDAFAEHTVGHLSEGGPRTRITVPETVIRDAAGEHSAPSHDRAAPQAAEHAHPEEHPTGHDAQPSHEENPAWSPNPVDKWSGLDAEHIVDKLEKTWGIDVFGFTPEIHPELLREYARAVDAMFEKYPGTNLTAVGIGKLDDLVYAVADPVRGPNGWYCEKLILNQDLALHPDKLAQRAAEDSASGFHVPGSGDRPVYATILHEFGHAMDMTSQGVVQRRMMEALADHYVAEHGNTAGLRQWLNRTLSGYSFSSRDVPRSIVHPEAIAEAFTDVELNGDQASAPAKIIHKVLVDALAERAEAHPATDRRHVEPPAAEPRAGTPQPEHSSAERPAAAENASGARDPKTRELPPERARDAEPGKPLDSRHGGSPNEEGGRRPEEPAAGGEGGKEPPKPAAVPGPEREPNGDNGSRTPPAEHPQPETRPVAAEPTPEPSDWLKRQEAVQADWTAAMEGKRAGWLRDMANLMPEGSPEHALFERRADEADARAQVARGSADQMWERAGGREGDPVASGGTSPEPAEANSRPTTGPGSTVEATVPDLRAASATPAEVAIAEADTQDMPLPARKPGELVSVAPPVEAAPALRSAADYLRRSGPEAGVRERTPAEVLYARRLVHSLGLGDAMGRRRDPLAALRDVAENARARGGFGDPRENLPPRTMRPDEFGKLSPEDRFFPKSPEPRSGETPRELPLEPWAETNHGRDEREPRALSLPELRRELADRLGLRPEDVTPEHLTALAGELQYRNLLRAGAIEALGEAMDRHDQATTEGRREAYTAVRDEWARLLGVDPEHLARDPEATLNRLRAETLRRADDVADLVAATYHTPDPEAGRRLVLEADGRRVHVEVTVGEDGVPRVTEVGRPRLPARPESTVREPDPGLFRRMWRAVKGHDYDGQYPKYPSGSGNDGAGQAWLLRFMGKLFGHEFPFTEHPGEALERIASGEEHEWPDMVHEFPLARILKEGVTIYKSRERMPLLSYRKSRIADVAADIHPMRVRGGGEYEPWFAEADPRLRAPIEADLRERGELTEADYIRARAEQQTVEIPAVSGAQEPHRHWASNLPEPMARAAQARDAALSDVRRVVAAQRLDLPETTPEALRKLVAEETYRLVRRAGALEALSDVAQRFNEAEAKVPHKPVAINDNNPLGRYVREVYAAKEQERLQREAAQQGQKHLAKGQDPSTMPEPGKPKPTFLNTEGTNVGSEWANHFEDPELGFPQSEQGDLFHDALTRDQITEERSNWAQLLGLDLDGLGPTKEQLDHAIAAQRMAVRDARDRLSEFSAAVDHYLELDAESERRTRELAEQTAHSWMDANGGAMLEPGVGVRPGEHPGDPNRLVVISGEENHHALLAEALAARPELGDMLNRGELQLDYRNVALNETDGSVHVVAEETPHARFQEVTVAGERTPVVMVRDEHGPWQLVRPEHATPEPEAPKQAGGPRDPDVVREERNAAAAKLEAQHLDLGEHLDYTIAALRQDNMLRAAQIEGIADYVRSGDAIEHFNDLSDKLGDLAHVLGVDPKDLSPQRLAEEITNPKMRSARRRQAIGDLFDYAKELQNADKKADSHNRPAYKPIVTEARDRLARRLGVDPKDLYGSKWHKDEETSRLTHFGPDKHSTDKNAMVRAIKDALKDPEQRSNVTAALAEFAHTLGTLDPYHPDLRFDPRTDPRANDGVLPIHDVAGLALLNRLMSEYVGEPVLSDNPSQAQGVWSHLQGVDVDDIDHIVDLYEKKLPGLHRQMPPQELRRVLERHQEELGKALERQPGELRKELEHRPEKLMRELERQGEKRPVELLYPEYVQRVDPAVRPLSEADFVRLVDTVREARFAAVYEVYRDGKIDTHERPEPQDLDAMLSDLRTKVGTRELDIDALERLAAEHHALTSVPEPEAPHRSPREHAAEVVEARQARDQARAQRDAALAQLDHGTERAVRESDLRPQRLRGTLQYLATRISEDDGRLVNSGERVAELERASTDFTEADRRVTAEEARLRAVVEAAAGAGEMPAELWQREVDGARGDLLAAAAATPGDWPAHADQIVGQLDRLTRASSEHGLPPELTPLREAVHRYQTAMDFQAAVRPEPIESVRRAETPQAQAQRELRYARQDADIAEVAVDSARAGLPVSEADLTRDWIAATRAEFGGTPPEQLTPEQRSRLRLADVAEHHLDLQDRAARWQAQLDNLAALAAHAEDTPHAAAARGIDRAQAELRAAIASFHEQTGLRIDETTLLERPDAALANLPERILANPEADFPLPGERPLDGAANDLRQGAEKVHQAEEFAHWIDEHTADRDPDGTATVQEIRPPHDPGFAASPSRFGGEGHDGNSAGGERPGSKGPRGEDPPALPAGLTRESLDSRSGSADNEGEPSEPTGSTPAAAAKPDPAVQAPDPAVAHGAGTVLPAAEPAVEVRWPEESGPEAPLSVNPAVASPTLKAVADFLADAPLEHNARQRTPEELAYLARLADGLGMVEPLSKRPDALASLQELAEMARARGLFGDPETGAGPTSMRDPEDYRPLTLEERYGGEEFWRTEVDPRELAAFEAQLRDLGLTDRLEQAGAAEATARQALEQNTAHGEARDLPLEPWSDTTHQAGDQPRALTLDELRRDIATRLGLSDADLAKGRLPEVAGELQYRNMLRAGAIEALQEAATRRDAATDPQHRAQLAATRDEWARLLRVDPERLEPEHRAATLTALRDETVRRAADVADLMAATFHESDPSAPHRLVLEMNGDRVHVAVRTDADGVRHLEPAARPGLPGDRLPAERQPIRPPFLRRLWDFVRAGFKDQYPKYASGSGLDGTGQKQVIHEIGGWLHNDFLEHLDINPSRLGKELATFWKAREDLPFFHRLTARVPDVASEAVPMRTRDGEYEPWLSEVDPSTRALAAADLRLAGISQDHSTSAEPRTGAEPVRDPAAVTQRDPLPQLPPGGEHAGGAVEPARGPSEHGGTQSDPATQPRQHEAGPTREALPKTLADRLDARDDALREVLKQAARQGIDLRTADRATLRRLVDESTYVMLRRAGAVEALFEVAQRYNTEDARVPYSRSINFFDKDPLGRFLRELVHSDPTRTDGAVAKLARKIGLIGKADPHSTTLDWEGTPNGGEPARNFDDLSPDELETHKAGVLFDNALYRDQTREERSNWAQLLGVGLDELTPERLRHTVSELRMAVRAHADQVVDLGRAVDDYLRADSEARTVAGDLADDAARTWADEQGGAPLEHGIAVLPGEPPRLTVIRADGEHARALADYLAEHPEIGRQLNDGRLVPDFRTVTMDGAGRLHVVAEHTPEVRFHEPEHNGETIPAMTVRDQPSDRWRVVEQTPESPVPHEDPRPLPDSVDGLRAARDELAKKLAVYRDDLTPDQLADAIKAMRHDNALRAAQIEGIADFIASSDGIESFHDLNDALQQLSNRLGLDPAELTPEKMVEALTDPGMRTVRRLQAVQDLVGYAGAVRGVDGPAALAARDRLATRLGLTSEDLYSDKYNKTDDRFEPDPKSIAAPALLRAINDMMHRSVERPELVAALTEYAHALSAIDPFHEGLRFDPNTDPRVAEGELPIRDAAAAAALRGFDLESLGEPPRSDDPSGSGSVWARLQGLELGDDPARAAKAYEAYRDGKIEKFERPTDAQTKSTVEELRAEVRARTADIAELQRLAQAYNDATAGPEPVHPTAPPSLAAAELHSARTDLERASNSRDHALRRVTHPDAHEPHLEGAPGRRVEAADLTPQRLAATIEHLEALPVHEGLRSGHDARVAELRAAAEHYNEAEARVRAAEAELDRSLMAGAHPDEPPADTLRRELEQAVRDRDRAMRGVRVNASDLTPEHFRDALDEAAQHARTPEAQAEAGPRIQRLHDATVRVHQIEELIARHEAAAEAQARAAESPLDAARRESTAAQAELRAAQADRDAIMTGPKTNSAEEFAARNEALRAALDRVDQAQAVAHRWSTELKRLWAAETRAAVTPHEAAAQARDEARAALRRAITDFHAATGLRVAESDLTPANHGPTIEELQGKTVLANGPGSATAFEDLRAAAATSHRADALAQWVDDNIPRSSEPEPAGGDDDPVEESLPRPQVDPNDPSTWLDRQEAVQADWTARMDAERARWLHEIADGMPSGSTEQRFARLRAENAELLARISADRADWFWEQAGGRPEDPPTPPHGGDGGEEPPTPAGSGAGGKKPPNPPHGNTSDPISEPEPTGGHPSEPVPSSDARSGSELGRGKPLQPGGSEASSITGVLPVEAGSNAGAVSGDSGGGGRTHSGAENSEPSLPSATSAKSAKSATSATPATFESPAGPHPLGEVEPEATPTGEVEPEAAPTGEVEPEVALTGAGGQESVRTGAGGQESPPTAAGEHEAAPDHPQARGSASGGRRWDPNWRSHIPHPPRQFDPEFPQYTPQPSQQAAPWTLLPDANPPQPPAPPNPPVPPNPPPPPGVPGGPPYSGGQPYASGPGSSGGGMPGQPGMPQLPQPPAMPQAPAVPPYQGGQMPPGGSVPNGQLPPWGSWPDSAQQPGGSSQWPDGSQTWPNGSQQWPDGSQQSSDGTQQWPNGSQQSPNGSQQWPGSTDGRNPGHPGSPSTPHSPYKPGGPHQPGGPNMPGGPNSGAPHGPNGAPGWNPVPDNSFGGYGANGADSSDGGANGAAGSSGGSPGGPMGGGSGGQPGGQQGGANGGRSRGGNRFPRASGPTSQSGGGVYLRSHSGFGEFAMLNPLTGELNSAPLGAGSPSGVYDDLDGLRVAFYRDHQAGLVLRVGDQAIEVDRLGADVHWERTQQGFNRLLVGVGGTAHCEVRYRTVPQDADLGLLIRDVLSDPARRAGIFG